MMNIIAWSASAPWADIREGFPTPKIGGKYKAEQEFEDGLLVVKDASEKQYSVAGARIDSVANEEFEDFCLTVFDSPYSGEVVHVGAMDFCSLCDEALDQSDIARADGYLKAPLKGLLGWRSLCRHALQYRAVGWEKILAQILAQNAADYARMMPFCPTSADVND
ncbi:MAG: hypothetical protein WBE37_13120 [Bryobacteraceae bacterium]